MSQEDLGMGQEDLELALVIDRREQFISSYEAALANIGDPDETDPYDIWALAMLHSEVIRWTAALDLRLRRLPGRLL